MSNKNQEFILNNNPFLNKDSVEVCPNSVEPNTIFLSDEEKNSLKNKYHIPLNKRVFVYGGNFGKPQGILFIVQCLKELKNDSKAFFFLVGDGTEYKVLEKFINDEIQILKDLKMHEVVSYDTTLNTTKSKRKKTKKHVVATNIVEPNP